MNEKQNNTPTHTPNTTTTWHDVGSFVYCAHKRCHCEKKKANIKWSGCWWALSGRKSAAKEGTKTWNTEQKTKNKNRGAQGDGGGCCCWKEKKEGGALVAWNAKFQELAKGSSKVLEPQVTVLGVEVDVLLEGRVPDERHVCGQHHELLA